MFNNQTLLSDDNDNFETLKLTKNLHKVEVSNEESIISGLLDQPSIEISSPNNIGFEQKSLRELKEFPQIIAIAIKPHAKREAVIPEFSIRSSSNLL